MERALCGHRKLLRERARPMEVEPFSDSQQSSDSVLWKIEILFHTTKTSHRACHLGQVGNQDADIRLHGFNGNHPKSSRGTIPEIHQYSTSPLISQKLHYLILLPFTQKSDFVRYCIIFFHLNY